MASIHSYNTTSKDMEAHDEVNPYHYEGPEEDRLREIARSMTRASSLVSAPMTGFENPFDPANQGGELDPNSPNFKARKWLKNMYALYASDPDTFPLREMGISFRNLGAYGYGQDTNFQRNVLNSWLAAGIKATRFLSKSDSATNRVQILKSMDGVVNPGEMLLVLGRPGAGCSTFLRTMAANTYGFQLDEKTELNYAGLTQPEVAGRFRGDVVYCAESETHIPQLTVGDTLLFASRMKTPEVVPGGVSREEYAKHTRDMIMATYGLTHTMNTRVGNDLIRGVSGGERKRVSIAELAICGSQFQCWDNSTRGLDSATALEFIRSLRNSADIFKATNLVAVYQASEEMYSLFDKVTVLYEGYQIYFGPIKEAREFFYNMGWEPKPRQSTPDFLTSLSQPSERVCRVGFEDRVPRTAEEFYQRWISSSQHTAVCSEIDAFNAKFTPEHAASYRIAYKAQRAKSLPSRAAYTVSFAYQIKALIARGFKTLIGEPSMPLTGLIGNSIFALILASLFYNMKGTTDSFYSRNVLIFFALLFNSIMTILEVFELFTVREIVRKHHQYALYHPAIEAFSSLIVNLPQKITLAVLFNVTVYFLPNLRREAGNFFFFMLVMFTCSLLTSLMFRTIGAASKTFAIAMVVSNLILFALIVFIGFIVPLKAMHRWCKWIYWINPLSYAFESMMANEYHNREFKCSSFAPSGPGIELANQVCIANGAVPGSATVLGDDYIKATFNYSVSHMWRNFGILCVWTVFYFFTYMLCVWFNPGERTKGEFLVWPRRILRKHQLGAAKSDIENGSGLTPTQTIHNSDANTSSEKQLEASNDTFYWKDLTYDIKIKGEERRLLNYVDGWVKPGTLTALMGASGAGKTTLLDTLANRVTMGVVSGHIFVNGFPRDNTFQRSTGYAMQQDVHLSTATVREALTFSALLRQPYSVPYEEKIAYVDTVLNILEMEPYADAVIGTLGQGLNVEQHKRLTIGVELAAKPKLLLFLDEPTSGLDSQTAWSICQLLKKLSNHGQAILCTIHQPSALLLQQFDRLLFLARGGRTVYFGDIGENSKTLTGYFEKHGADPCPPDANPAEWMLQVIGAAPGSTAKHDYAEVWAQSDERKAVRAEIASLMKRYDAKSTNVNPDSTNAGEFAAPLHYQFRVVLKRTFRHLWRDPGYTWSKLFLTVVTNLFNGFTFFKADTTQQGLQNLMFSVFMFTIILNSILDEGIPVYVNSRNQYEVRERPSKMYSWIVFLTTQMVGEIPWQTLTSVLGFLTWFYPIGFTRIMGLTHSTVSRSGIAFFFCWLFYMYSTSFSFLVSAGIDDADTAVNVGTLLFPLTQIFSGVLVTKEKLPGFWIFMYRVSPMTYFIQGILSNNVGRGKLQCSSYELLTVNPPDGLTCGQYLEPYLNQSTGYVLNGDATADCNFCNVGATDVFLDSIDANYSHRWRNLGIFAAFIGINYLGALLLYYLARVPKKGSRVKKTPLDSYTADPLLEKAQ